MKIKISRKQIEDAVGGHISFIKATNNGLSAMMCPESIEIVVEDTQEKITKLGNWLIDTYEHTDSSMYYIAERLIEKGFDVDKL